MVLGNPIEISYEDFISKPLNFLKNIYKKLNLERYKNSEKKFTDYLKTQSNIKTQTYETTDSVKVE